MFEVVVYFAGPRSVWAGQPHLSEVIARRSARWLWLAHALGQSVLKHVDTGRCGYVVMRGGELVHHERAADEDSA